MVSFFITDNGKDIINLAQHNLNLNNTKEDINFTVMELDWFSNKFSPGRNSKIPVHSFFRQILK